MEIHSKSFYTTKLEDGQAVYLLPDRFPVKADGIADDSDAIQAAINLVKEANGYGVVLIPEGTYKITKTLYIPKAIRLIGYGEKRPVLVLSKNSPGFNTFDHKDKGQARYMIWFVDRVPKSGEEVVDAHPGTFYSALSNVDLVIEEGNQAAVALRTHYAQHSFVSHVDIHIGTAKAGMFDVGNEMEDVRFFGGDYGIYTTKPSPGWPFVMVDTYFEGQRKAAILTREAGLTISRMQVRNSPIAIETEPDFVEKLYMEDSCLVNVEKALIISNENNAHNQINLRNVSCSQVPILAAFRQSGKVVDKVAEHYLVEAFGHGLQMDDLGTRPEIKTVSQMKAIDSPAMPMMSDIPQLPSGSTWVNLMDLGAVGDGIADDTLVLREAIKKHRTLYLPQGFYRVTDTITLEKDTVLIGLNPISTRLMLAENTEAYGGLGTPKPLLETPQGGTNVVMGIGIDAGARNPRAVGCKWMAGEKSYMNDVKFLGGHGSMNKGGYAPVYNQNRTGDANPEVRWDAQYWSFWVTNGGGGVFKDVWTASTYAEAGFYASDTETPATIYAMSVEHHVRHEVKFKNVHNWKVLALQLEEEVAESWHCQPLELAQCSHMLFANLYFFRVIWLVNPYPYAMNSWDNRDMEFLGIHNYTQIKQTIDNTLLDVNTGLEVRPWELSRLYLSGDTPSKQKPVTTGEGYEVEELANGFEFADAICHDSKGNVYFVDSRWKRIYHYAPSTKILRLVADIHYKPLQVACDSEDRLLVTVEYFPPKGATLHGEPEVYHKPSDSSGTSYGDWYNVGSTVKVYTMDPQDPYSTLQELKTVPMGTVKNVAKALYPANRWRDSSDYMKVTVKRPEECYVALDGVTIIPVTYDLMRASTLLEAIPGEPFYAVDEYLKRTVLFDITPEGYAHNPRVFAEKGEYSAIQDEKGNVYVPDGEIYVVAKDGSVLSEIHIPLRPACLVTGDPVGKTLYVTARGAFYKVTRK